MASTSDLEALQEDWVYGLFESFRAELVSVSESFRRRVAEQIGVFADAADMNPPSTGSLLLSVALESTNIAADLARGGDDDGDDDDDGRRPTDDPPGGETEED